MSFTDRFYPNEIELCLIKASLKDRTDTLDNWNRWKSKVEWDDIDGISLRLIPFLYESLLSSGVSQELLGSYKGIMKRTWYQNSMALNQVFRLVSQMNRDISVTPTLLKGAELNVSYYDHVGLRQMSDIDILVDMNDMEKTINWMDQKGWKFGQGSKSKFSDLIMRNGLPDELLLKQRHAVELSDERKSLNIDLHRNIYSTEISGDSDLGYLSRMTLKESPDYRYFSLSSSDMLVHIIEHGIRSQSSNKLIWILDALKIIESSDIDWHLLASYRDSIQISSFLKLGLKYLFDYDFVEIPDELRYLFGDFIFDQREKSVIERFLSPNRAIRSWTKYAYSYPQRSKIRKLISFPMYLSHLHGLKSPLFIPTKLI